MIKSIHIKNFQSHKKTELELSPGVNSIIGDSDSGKSSILRALYWIIQNRPSGSNYISHWARMEDNGKPPATSVTIEGDFGKLTRYRKGKTDNSYILPDDVSLDAVGTEVPKQVSELLNISEVNIQKQQDAPFLLSSSAGEVARFFNSVIKLEDIDLILSAADSYKRSTNSELKREESEYKSIIEELNQYEWLKKALYTLKELEKMADSIKEMKEKIAIWEELIKDRSFITKKLAGFKGLSAIIPLLKETQTLFEQIKPLQDNLFMMEEDIGEYKGILSNIESFPDLKKLGKKYLEVISLYKEKEIQENKAKEMKEIIPQYLEIKKTIKELSSAIIELNEELPATCPLCGAPLNKEER